MNRRLNFYFLYLFERILFSIFLKGFNETPIINNMKERFEAKSNPPLSSLSNLSKIFKKYMSYF